MKNFELSHLALIMAIFALTLKFVLVGTPAFWLGVGAGYFFAICAFILAIAALVVSKNKTVALAGIIVSVLAFIIVLGL